MNNLQTINNVFSVKVAFISKILFIAVVIIVTLTSAIWALRPAQTHLNYRMYRNGGTPSSSDQLKMMSVESFSSEIADDLLRRNTVSYALGFDPTAGLT